MKRRDFSVLHLSPKAYQYECEFCGAVCFARRVTKKRICCGPCSFHQELRPVWTKLWFGRMVVSILFLDCLMMIVFGAKSRQPEVVAFGAGVLFFFFVYIPIQHHRDMERDEAELRGSGLKPPG